MYLIDGETFVVTPRRTRIPMREQSGETEESDEVLHPGSCAGFKRMNSSSSSMRAQIRDSRVIHITHRGALARTVDSAAQHDWGIECVPWTMGAVIDASSPAQRDKPLTRDMVIHPEVLLALQRRGPVMLRKRKLCCVVLPIQRRRVLPLLRVLPGR